MILQSAAAATVDSDALRIISASGGNISYLGVYAIHTFSSSGDFIVNYGEANIDFLVVGGGGGGGYSPYGGGGGAGGVKESYGFITPGTYTVTVGAGGAGGDDYVGPSNSGLAQNGGNSNFFGVTAHGGGGAATQGFNETYNYEYGYAKSGASGGGGASSGNYAAGATSSYAGEGYAGGEGSTVLGKQPGAGGGAGGVGESYTEANSYIALGGPGVYSTITGTSREYGKGGNANGLLAAFNTQQPNYNGFGGNNGYKGGSFPGAYDGWDGSSGVVIIKYQYK